MSNEDSFQKNIDSLSTDKDAMLSELEQIKTELDQLMKESDISPAQPKKSKNIAKDMPPSFGNFYLFAGVLFLIMFFVTVQSESALLKIISAISFAIAALALIRVLADMMYAQKKTAFTFIVGLAVALMLTISLLYFWNQLLEPYKLILFWILFILLAINAFFFILHSYFAYIQRKGQTETSITGLILIVSLIIALATYVYGHVLLYVLFVVIISLFCKATIDFSKRFRVSKRK